MLATREDILVVAAAGQSASCSRSASVRPADGGLGLWFSHKFLFGLVVKVGRCRHLGESEGGIVESLNCWIVNRESNPRGAEAISGKDRLADRMPAFQCHGVTGSAGLERGPKG